jgi:hypothetical protein
VTESHALAAAPDGESARPPERDRSQRDARDARREVVCAHAGALTGLFPNGYERDLRDDWPD